MDGEKLLTLPARTFEIAGEGGGKGGDGEAVGNDCETPTASLEGESEGKPLDSKTRRRAEVKASVDRIWDHYVAVMAPRNKTAGDEERSIIRKALSVATEQECLTAITGCKQSPWHQGDNPQRKKYKTLSHILKGKRGKRTTREQIDMFLDLAKGSTGVGNFPSADRAIVAEQQRMVQRGHRLSQNEDAVKQAKDAEAWLRQHGIETVLNPEGIPVFRPLDAEDAEGGE